MASKCRAQSRNLNLVLGPHRLAQKLCQEAEASNHKRIPNMVPNNSEKVPT